MIPEYKIDPKLLQNLIRNNDGIDLLNIISHDISLTDSIIEAYKENQIAKTIVESLQNPSEQRWPSKLRSLLRKDKVGFKVSNGLAYFRA